VTCDELATGLAELFQARRSGLAVAIERTSLPEEEWTYHDLAHNLFATVQRRARALLEQRDALPPREKHADGAEWVFWAEEPLRLRSPFANRNEAVEAEARHHGRRAGRSVSAPPIVPRKKTAIRLSASRMTAAASSRRML